MILGTKTITLSKKRTFKISLRPLLVITIIIIINY